MNRVFVSYSRNNLQVVTQLIQDIQAVGIDTWHDQTLTGALVGQHPREHP